MSNLSGGGGTGFNRPVSPQTYTTQIQARQAELQQKQQAAVGAYGTPVTGDAFSRTVQEQVVATAIPSSNPFRSDLSKTLYPKKGEKANPFAKPGGDIGGLALNTEIDWSARQQFGENTDSLASLS